MSVFDDKKKSVEEYYNNQIEKYEKRSSAGDVLINEATNKKDYVKFLTGGLVRNMNDELCLMSKNMRNMTLYTLDLHEDVYDVVNTVKRLIDDLRDVKGIADKIPTLDSTLTEMKEKIENHDDTYRSIQSHLEKMQKESDEADEDYSKTTGGMYG